MLRDALAGAPRRGLALLAILLVVLCGAPWLAGDYLLTVLITILYFAYTGQAWNVMMGFAGQLSLGHAMYVGLGAYAAALLYVHLGIGPWIGMLAAIAIAGACGAAIGFLASASTTSAGSAARPAFSCQLPTTPAMTSGICAAAP
jgi:branched-chain amino acid transport system permease protein